MRRLVKEIRAVLLPGGLLGFLRDLGLWLIVGALVLAVFFLMVTF